jgi:hypothetical protein
MWEVRERDGHCEVAKSQRPNTCKEEEDEEEEEEDDDDDDDDDLKYAYNIK